MLSRKLFSLLLIAAFCLAFLDIPNSTSLSVNQLHPNQSVTTFALSPVETYTFTNANSSVITATDFGEGSMTTVDMSYSTTTFVMNSAPSPYCTVQVIQVTATSGQIISGYEMHYSVYPEYWIMSPSQYTAYQNNECFGPYENATGDPGFLTSSNVAGGEGSCGDVPLAICGAYSSFYAPSDGTYYFVFANSGPVATVTFVGGLSTNDGSSLGLGTTFAIAALVILGALVLALMRRRSLTTRVS